MVPNTRLFFFFTYENQPNISKEYFSVQLQQPEFVNFHIHETQHNFMVKNMNLLEADFRKPNVINQEYKPVVDSLPRKKREQVKISKLAKQATKKPPWSIPISVFKDYKIDTEDMRNRCFETDWANGKYPNFIKNEEDRAKVKEHCRKVYRILKDTYRHWASHTPLDKLFGIGVNNYTELTAQMGVLSDKVINLSSLDIEFGKTNYTNEKGVNNNKNYLMRFEFLEMMVRVAGYAFMQAEKKFKTWEEAVEHYINKYCEPYYKQYDQMHVWRESIAWREENDYILKKHMQIFDSVYNQYSGRKVLPGKKPQMCIDEFRSLVQDIGCMHDIPEKMVSLVFCSSMMTQVNELTSDRIFEMSKVEFIEAFIRLGDKTSLCNLYYMIDREETEKRDPNEYIDRAVRDKQALGLKLEALLVRCMDTVVPKSTMKAYKRPINS